MRNARSAINALAWSPLAIALIGALPAVAAAGPRSAAAKEAAEYVLRKFGKEAAGEGAEKLATRIESLAARHGDDALEAVRKAGPRGLAAVEEAGSHGAAAARLLAREGDRALWVVEHPARLKLLAAYGDDAAEAMLKHKGLAEPLITSFEQPAAKALRALDGQNARRLAMLADSGDLARIGRTGPLLDTIGRYGNRGMDFVWRNKKALAVGAALTAFLSNPQALIDGTADIARDFARPVAESIGVEAAKRADWTQLGVTALAVVGCYLCLRLWLRQRWRRLALR